MKRMPVGERLTAPGEGRREAPYAVGLDTGEVDLPAGGFYKNDPCRTVENARCRDNTGCQAGLALVKQFHDPEGCDGSGDPIDE